jgi:RNA polymerase sigma-70 factor (ECF subfamily)
MSSDDVGARLSRIDTLTSQVRDAVRGSGEAARQAQEQLFERYRLAVHRYLLGALRDEQAADEVFGRLWEKVLTGGLQGFDPAKGRFRNYLRTVLSRLVCDHRNERHKRREITGEGVPEAEDPSPDADQLFSQSWTRTLCDLAMQALKEANPTYHVVLRLREEGPDLSSEELAERAAEALDVSLDVPNARKLLHRARERFGDLLLQEVIRSLGHPSRDELLEELGAVGWRHYLQAALDRRGLGG